MADSPKYHPSFAITNVKSLIPITLDAAGMYHSWAALFKVLCRVHELTYHIIPPTEETKIAAYDTTKKADLAYWKRLDAAVLNWIYGSISHDLLTAILLKDDTAQGAWARLGSMFQDNKAARASHLEQMTASLPEAYAGTVDFIQNQEPLPSFESCRSCLKLAQRTIKHRLAKEGGTTSRPTALVSSTTHHQEESSGNSTRLHNRNSKQKRSSNKPSNKKCNTGPAQKQQAGPLGQPYSWQLQQASEEEDTQPLRIQRRRVASSSSTMNLNAEQGLSLKTHRCDTTLSNESPIEGKGELTLVAYRVDVHSYVLRFTLAFDQDC
uniref:Retrotransposon Copia-like N-terminal domain-containing protein n=1 Tax=Chenopodium quinoa TaxID=63459 RepID=A0A803MGR4_CHEQI